MHTILVPVDGSNHAMKALQIACDLGEKYGGRIALLHVLVESRKAADLLRLAIARSFDAKLTASLNAAADEDEQATPHLLEAVGREVLDNAADRVRRRGLEADLLEIHVGDPADSILRAQKSTEAGTIVMGCRGSTTSGRSSFGSVSRAVFERADCTCLSVK